MIVRTLKLLLIPIAIIALLTGCGGGGGGGGTIPVDPGGDGENQSPSITSLSPQGTASSPIKLSTGAKQHLVVAATDPDKKDVLTFSWSADKGQVAGTGTDIEFTAPSSACNAVVTVTVSDGHKHSATAKCYFSVGNAQDPTETNDPPEITGLTATPDSIETGATSNLSAIATDPDGDHLTYSWQANGGTVQSSNGNTAVWLAPATAGSYTITVYVSDGHNTAVSKNVSVGVATKPEPPVTNGLTAKYIQNDDIQHPDLEKGEVILTRTDATINFDWGRKAPDPLFVLDSTTGSAAYFGVIWTGYIKCETAGTYSFGAEYDDGFRLAISDDNGTMRTVVDAWNLGPRPKEQGTITLQGGKWYKLEAQYYENQDRSYVRLWWLPPNTAEWVIVPTDVLRVDEEL